MVFFISDQRAWIVREWRMMNARRWKAFLLGLTLFTVLTLAARPVSGQDDSRGFEIRSLSGEPDYKSVNLTWEVESVTGDDRLAPYKGRSLADAAGAGNTDGSARSFSVFYCELQNWGPHRCRSKIVTDESADSGKSKQYSLLVKNLRMATKYSFHVKPQAKGGELQRASGRADEGDERPRHGGGVGGAGEAAAAANVINAGQTIIIPTKGFSAHATQCLPHASEIEVETGPYFGGRIAAENGHCGVQGDASSPRDTYVMRIDHEQCGSKVSTRELTVETYITVQENLGILTHSTRRFVVVCTFQPDTLTVRARLALPGKGGAAPVLPASEWWPANGRNARVRQFNMVGKSGLVLKGSREDEKDEASAPALTGKQEEEEDSGVPAQVRELPSEVPGTADGTNHQPTAAGDGEGLTEESGEIFSRKSNAVREAAKAARLLNTDRQQQQHQTIDDDDDEGNGVIDQLDEYGQEMTDSAPKTASSQRRSATGETSGGANNFDTSGLLISACLAVILVGALVYVLQREFKKQRMIHQHQQMERTASERRGGGSTH